MAEGTRAAWRRQLTDLTDDEVVALLGTHSGLPGPRANLTLLAAFGDVAREPLVRRLAGDDDEYLAACGTAALGRLLADASGPRLDELVDVLTARADDERWRVREGAAMAVQRLGAADPAATVALVRRWLAGPRPLVVRASVAGTCEPALLAVPELRALALEACARGTDVLRAVPAGERRTPDVRTLRQALGYCWSVAVAADPEPGLAAFAALERDDDADVAWVVRENRGKRRLAVLLGPDV
ncbi:HEAT repeat domain-containing protein [Cellulomonas sp. PSBB021]|uniref:HEAT repeat domain-containing protein n=1 Tax=Cellulomonas sp. PSBB021 TaxID=2003551 RepID=UPI001E3C7650|nr:HEAT repeat domain-containing protein [Cellulomonas sp. PSBB021]